MGKKQEIKVYKQSPTDDGWQFTVWVGTPAMGEEKEKRDVTEHAVNLDREYWKHLTKGVGAPADIVKKSFEFLLKREPREKILKSFDLRKIKKHFPEFEKEVMPEEPYKEARAQK